MKKIWKKFEESPIYSRYKTDISVYIDNKDIVDCLLTDVRRKYYDLEYAKIPGNGF